MAIKGLEFLEIRNLRCMLDDIARETDVGVFYSFSGPVEIIIFHFLSRCSFLFDLFNPFNLKSFHSHNDLQKQFQSLFWKKLRNE